MHAKNVSKNKNFEFNVTKLLYTYWHTNKNSSLPFSSLGWCIKTSSDKWGHIGPITWAKVFKMKYKTVWQDNLSRESLVSQYKLKSYLKIRKKNNKTI